MNDQELVTALKAQDPGAVRELLEAHGDRLLRSAFWLCGNETEAQDFVQETVLQAIHSVHRFQGRSTIYTWLYGILLNVNRQYQRSHERLVYDETIIGKEIAEENPGQLDARIATSALWTGLKKLSGAHREVVILRYYEDMKIQEIADHLGISKGTVKSRLHYAIQELQTFLPAEMNLFGANDTEEIQRP
jgi:RNA polymerase sigma-70 factor (ECF subfamily)